MCLDREENVANEWMRREEKKPPATDSKQIDIHSLDHTKMYVDERETDRLFSTNFGI